MINITLQHAFFPPTIQNIMDIFPSYHLETLDRTVSFLPKFHRILNKVNRNISFVFLVIIFWSLPKEVQSTHNCFISL